MIDNWTTFKTVLQADLEAFQGIVQFLQVSYEKSNIIAERQQLQAQMIPFASLSEAVSHYLEVMDQIETGIYVDPDSEAVIGGTAAN